MTRMLSSGIGGEEETEIAAARRRRRRRREETAVDNDGAIVVVVALPPATGLARLTTGAQISTSLVSPLPFASPPRLSHSPTAASRAFLCQCLYLLFWAGFGPSTCK
uniref:Uncharacterized protein n=1 Tax=Oryza punctata TaxID=4537 RepID=A0A0E0KXD3_ORYPU